MLPVDSTAMRNALRYWASGVSIVTTQLGERRGGVTVSAFNSLSVTPPQILVCLSKEASAVPLILEAGFFAVSILGDQHAPISDVFGGRIKPAEGMNRFDGLEWKTAITGAPILSDAIAYLDCTVAAQYDGSTHWIVVGAVATADTVSDSASPLVYYNRAYRALNTFE